jgi:hypothetical protein
LKKGLKNKFEKKVPIWKISKIDTSRPTNGRETWGRTPLTHPNIAGGVVLNIFLGPSRGSLRE